MPEDKEISQASYERAWEQLEKLAVEKEAVGEEIWAEELTASAANLRQWLDDGRPGDCPVDLPQYAEHGISLQPAAASTIVEKAENAPSDNNDEPPPTLVMTAIAEPLAEETATAEETTDLGPSDDQTSAELDENEAALAAEVDNLLLPLEQLDEHSGNGRPSEEDVADALGLETPEQATLRTQKVEVDRYIAEGKWREAVALSSTLLSTYTLMPDDVHGTLQQALTSAQDSLNSQVAEALDLGHKAKSKGDTEAARNQYEHARQLDPDNQEVKDALWELDQAAVERLTVAQLSALAARLRERRDLQRLGDAVYQAERMDAEGKLTDEFITLLHDARQAYDNIRRAHGEETTMMRFGNLEARKAARDKIEERLNLDEKVIFDPTTNTMRATFEVLGEANQRYLEHSQDTAEYEVGRVSQALPASPVWALNRLEESLKQPFHEAHKRRLEQKRDEIEQLLNKQKEAAKLIARADSRSDFLEAFSLLLQAHDVFPYIPNLGARLGQAKLRATETLAANMAELHNEAERALNTEQFKAAHDYINQAATVPARWPEADKPRDLLDLLEVGKKLRQRVSEQEQIRFDFEKHDKTIRVQVANADTRPEGLTNFQAISADPRFAALPGFLALRSYLDQFKGVGEQVAEARAARASGDWERVEELTLPIHQSGKGGPLAQEVQELLDEATSELAIEKALSLLAADQVDEAGRIIDVQLKHPKYGPDLPNRLKDELTRIEAARAATPSLQPLFERAKGLAQGDKKEMLEGLRLFRYLHGDVLEPGREGWPPYQLWQYAAEARKQAGELRRKLRDLLLPPIQDVYKQRANMEKLTAEYDLRSLADDAHALRGSRLLDNETERTAVRWLELRQGRLDAESREKNGDWEGAVNLWERLHDHYPRDVEADLRRARIQQALMFADRLRRDGQIDEAIARLRIVEREPGMGQSWEICLKLADLYAASGEFRAAFDNVNRAKHFAPEQKDIQTKQAELEREQKIQEVLAEADHYQAAGNPREALRTLQTALRQGATIQSGRLQQKRNDIFKAATAELQKTAEEKQASGQDVGKIEAVVALVDMRALEDQIEDEERRSEELLEPLRQDLEKVARSVIDKARTFDPRYMRLNEALREASELAGRLQTFSSVIPLFGPELGDMKDELERNRKDVSVSYDKLRELEKLLTAANEEVKWNDALISDNFDILEQYRIEIAKVNLNEMFDVRQFEDKLTEWREIHDYLRRAINAIKHKFVGDETFDGVRQDLRRLRTRPDSRPHNNLPWKQVRQQEYDRISQKMEPKLRVDDLYGADGAVLAGWANVERAADERQQEWEVWQQWDADCARLMDEAELLLTRAQSLGSNAPMTQRQTAWEKIKAAAETVVQTLEKGPYYKDVPVPVHSLKAKTLDTARKNRRAVAQEWLNAANLQLRAVGGEIEDSGFPSADEFSSATRQQNWVLLRSLIDRADQVGPSTMEEKNRLEKYRKVLNKESGEKKSFLDRIFNRNSGT